MYKFLSLLDKSQSKIAYATKIKFCDLYEELCKISEIQNQTPIETCWLIFYSKTPVICSICSKKAKFNSMKHGYHETCSNECGYELKKQKSGKKLQIAWDNRKSEILEKRAITCIERFGVEHALQSSDVKDRGKQTQLKLRGVNHHSKLESVQNQIKKSKLEKYESFSIIGIKGNAKRIKTNQIRYGTNNPSQSQFVKDRTKETCLNKSNEMKAKIKNKMSLSAIKRSNRGMYQKKIFTFPSGRTEKVQGYEPQALSILLSEGYHEDDILTSVPVIKYDEHRRYLPDIYIKSKNLLIEVKSDYTFKVDLDRNLRKQKASIEAGFLHEIWIMNLKGELIKKIS